MDHRLWDERFLRPIKKPDPNPQKITKEGLKRAQNRRRIEQLENENRLQKEFNYLE